MFLSMFSKAESSFWTMSFWVGSGGSGIDNQINTSFLICGIAAQDVFLLR
jgi:hypothetical protein